MISKFALRDYFERPLDNFDWIKTATQDQLIDQFAELEYVPDLKTEPWTHQLACIYIGICFPQFLYLLDMGTGKTKIVLDLAQYYKDIGEVKKVLVVVPTVLNVGEWEDEVKKHSNLRYVALHGSKEVREAALASEGDVYVINYDGLQTVMADFQVVTGTKAKRTKGGKQKKARKINDKLVRAFVRNFQMVIYDEIHEAKNPESLVYRLCNRITNACKVRYGLTGTPFGRDPADFWAEFYLIDKGDTLGKTMGLFRGAYFNVKNSYWGGKEYTFDKRKQDKLNKMIRNRSIVYSEDECQNLPPKVHKEIHIQLKDDCLAAYRLIVEQAENARMNQEEKENTYLKLREICSGFQYFKTEKGEKTTIRFSNNEKVEALQNVLDDMPPNKKLVIFHVFNESGSIIVDYLKAKKIKYAAINSTTKKDPVAEKKRFQTDIKCKVIVVNIASGSSGLNFQMANYTIYWEPTDRPIWYRQSIKRTNRGGQKFTTFYYHFFVKNSIEERVRSFLEEGDSLYKALLRGKTTFKDFRL